MAKQFDFTIGGFHGSLHRAIIVRNHYSIQIGINYSLKFQDSFFLLPRILFTNLSRILGSLVMLLRMSS